MGKRLKLGEMLVAKGLISETQLAAALVEQRRWGKRLGMTLVLMGFLEEETLIRTLAAQLKLPVARIRGKRVNAEVIELVPVELAEKHRCLPLFVKDQGGSRELFLAMEDPSDLDAQGELGFRIGFRIRPVLVAPTELEDALQRHYHWAACGGRPAQPAARRRARAAQRRTPQQAAAARRRRRSRSRTPSPSCMPPPPRRARAEEPGDTQPDPPDIERAAAELGAFGEPEPARPAAPRACPAQRARAPPRRAPPRPRCRPT